jgi:hypothetical protein
MEIMENDEKYSKENPFLVPEGYFEQFNQRLSEKINALPAEQTGKWKIKAISPYLAIAAGFLLVFTIWGTFLDKFGKNSGSGLTAENYPELRYFEMDHSSGRIEIIAASESDENAFILSSEEDIDLIMEQVDLSNILDEL